MKNVSLTNIKEVDSELLNCIISGGIGIFQEQEM